MSATRLFGDSKCHGDLAHRVQPAEDNYDKACDQALLALDLFERGDMVSARLLLSELLRTTEHEEVVVYAQTLLRCTWSHWFTYAVGLLAILSGVIRWALI